jgi:hypothetical protein
VKDDPALLDHYLTRAASRLRHRNANGSPKVLRCNSCGDSKSQPGATSAAILLAGDRWVYKCQRSRCKYNQAKLAVRWLKETDKELYAEYEKERGGLGGNGKLAEKLEAERKIAEEEAERKRKRDEAMDKKESKAFRPLKESDSEAIEYLRKRAISPGDFRFYVTDDESSRFSGCIIMPVIENGKAVYWQARKTWDDGGPKYINKRGGKKGFLLKTRDFDPSKPVLVCEGPFSALIAIPLYICIISIMGKPIFDIRFRETAKRGAQGGG